MIDQIKKELRKVADKEKAIILSRFFKTGKGEYGEGDKFLGVVVPEQRKISKKFLDLEVSDLRELLKSKFHEERLITLLILVEQYKQAKKIGDKKIQKKIFTFYLKNLKNINNWDLVDLSAPNIVGDYLFTSFSNKKLINSFLLKLVKSKNLWARRVAILATFTFIRDGEFAEILELTKFLILKQKEKHDLLHKALGWMCREVGKRDLKVLENFLDTYASQLPRVTLRYAIEQLPESKRRKYLAYPVF